MVDSQFFTFGNVKKCVIENNTIEENCTQNHGASVFLSSIGDQEDLQVRNNEIYMYGNGKANIMSGKGIFDNNKVVLAGSLNFIGYNNCFASLKNNKIYIIALQNVENIYSNSEVYYELKNEQLCYTIKVIF